jgi:hypothetical protein
MVEKAYWEESSKHQLVFYANDNSSLEGLSEKINAADVWCANDDEIVNLGIRRVNGRLYSGNYVGVCRLKSITGRNLSTSDGHEVILKIEPRFPVSVADMLNALSDDDEFERYLAPQTNRIDKPNLEIEDLRDNELFNFSVGEDPIFLKDSIARESSIITASVFITMLKNLCMRPLMGRMERREENLTGKVKGKVVFSKNIQQNTLRGRDDRVFCRYLEYSEDIIENQVLKAALNKAALFMDRYFGSASGNKNSFRDMISYCRNSLSHISYKKLSRYDMDRIKTTGVYAYYKPVVNAAKMVLSEITLEATGASTITSYVVPYAVSMEKLFEMFVRAYLKKAGIGSFNSAQPGLKLVQYDDKTAVLKEKDRIYSKYIAGNIKPDIVIIDDKDNYLVFDVKYKNAESRYSRSDRHQILAYALMMNCRNVGNIFPTQGGTENVCFRRNMINSKEKTPRYYNQVNLSIGAKWDFTIREEGELSTTTILEYCRRLLS